MRSLFAALSYDSYIKGWNQVSNSPFLSAAASSFFIVSFAFSHLLLYSVTPFAFYLSFFPKMEK